MSDGVFNAAIYDVVVHQPYQGTGIARLLLEDMIAQLREVSCIQLIATTGNEPFYAKMGFRKLKTGMAIYKNQQLAQEYIWIKGNGRKPTNGFRPYNFTPLFLDWMK